MSCEKRVVKAHKMTRSVIAVFPSASLAAIDAGQSPDAMRRRCRERTLGRGEAYYRFEDDFDPDESFEGRHRCPVVAVDQSTREWEWHPTAEACARALGVSYDAVLDALDGKHRVSGGIHLRWAPTRIHPRALTEALAPEPPAGGRRPPRGDEELIG